MEKKLDLIKSKIITDWNELSFFIAYCRLKDRKIVFTNGCFDILHRGHIEYLSKAARHGDELIVGLNSDASVKILKGESRPIQDEQSRALILAALGFVSRVVLFEQETPYELIKLVQPDVLIKGGDYKPEKIVGNDIVKAKGGKVVTIAFVPGFSTTGIINKMG
jgi:D-glycero-beta-D-manno-heptose 1-phosphate adenylyltransferase